MPDNEKLEIGKLEEHYDDILLNHLATIKEPMEKAIKTILENYDSHIGDVSYVFSKLADYYEKLTVAIDNYDVAVHDIDKEEDLDELQEVRNTVEEFLDVIESKVEDIVNFLKKEV